MTWLTQILRGFVKPFQWWVVVAEWEQGLRVRLGKRTRLLHPGLHFRIPFLDRVYVQSVRLRSVQNSNLTITTADEKAVTVSYVVFFRIADLRRLYNAAANPETTMEAAVAAAFCDHVNALNGRDVNAEAMAQAGCTAAKVRCEGWGLVDIDVQLTALAFVRAYRLLMADYRHGAGLYDLAENAGER